MDILELKVTKREEKGKSSARHFRNMKKIPGIIYGKGITPLSIIMDSKDLEKVLASHSGEHSVLSIKLDGNGGDKPLYAILKEVQHNVVTRDILHIDLYSIHLDEEIETSIPIIVTGDEELRKAEAVVQLMVEEVKLKCLPTNIPDSISIDVSLMKIGDQVKIKDLLEKTGYKILDDENEIVLLLIPAHVEKEEVPAAPPTEEEKPEETEKTEKTEKGEKGEKAEKGTRKDKDENR